MEFKRGERYNSNRLYSRLAHVHGHMMDRCYNPKCKEYKMYGARGVHVADEWHTFNNFLRDIDHLEGWDTEKYLNGQIQLDKDVKVSMNLVYSKETCVWLPSEENRKNQLAHQRLIEAVSPTGEVIEFTNMTEFAKHQGLHQPSISRAIKNNKPLHGWTFRVRQETLIASGPPKQLKVKIAVAYRNGQEVARNKIPSHLANQLNLDPRRVLECLKDYHEREEYKGYKFMYIYE